MSDLLQAVSRSYLLTIVFDALAIFHVTRFTSMIIAKTSAFAALMAVLIGSTAQASEARMSCSTSKCHANMDRAPYVHGPVKSKGCLICHEVSDAQATNHPKFRALSTAAINKRCFVCHENLPAQISAYKSVHKAIEKDGCVGCHNPHQSEHKKLLRKAPSSELCLSCHKEISNQQSEAVHHKLTAMNGGCTNCHAAHGSSHPKLLTAENTTALCLKCHDKPQSGAQRTVVPISPWLAQGKVRHEPFARGECIKCHQVHGSGRSHLLTGSYSENTYLPFEPEEFKLCFTCHKPTLVTSRQTADETGFRNGSSNLHYLHVLGQKKQRGCRTCHETHASDQDKLVRSSFAYKDHQLPIAYKKSTSGGSCLTACHKEMKYDRDKATENEKNRFD